MAEKDPNEDQVEPGLSRLEPSVSCERWKEILSLDEVDPPFIPCALLLYIGNNPCSSYVAFLCYQFRIQHGSTPL